MAKKINLGVFTKYSIFLGIILCLAFSMVLSFNLIPLGADSAYAKEPEYIGYTATDNNIYLNTGSSNMTSENIIDPITGQLTVKNYYKIPYLTVNLEESIKWNDAILNDLSANLFFNYNEFDNDGGTRPFHHMFSVNMTKTAGASNSIYAYPTAFNITGTNWRGESYSGTAAALTMAGVYKITSITLAYHIGAPCDRHAELLNAETDKITGTPNPLNIDGTITLTQLNVDIVVTSDLIIDATQSSSIGINNNLNIDESVRTYGSTANFRDIVKLHSVNSSGGFIPPSNSTYFSYSTKLNESYNIADNDTKFFKKFVNTGLGAYTSQTSNLQTAGGYANTTLAGISEFINIQWNKGSLGGIHNDELILTEIPFMQNVTNAGIYYLKIVPIQLINGYHPVKIVLSNTGEEYVQTFEILKKEINLDFDQKDGPKVGITLRTSKEYDQTISATGLFVNQELSQQDWISIGGLLQDFSTISLICSNKVLFDFAGTVFDSKEIGKRNVTLYANFINIGSGDSTYPNGPAINLVLSNYTPVPGRIVKNYENVDEYTNYEGIIDTNGYVRYNITDRDFYIVAPTVRLSFNPVEFSGTFNYGDAGRLFARDFSYLRYSSGVYYHTVDATNTTKNPVNGKVSVNNFDNWQMVFLGNNSGMVTDPTKNIIYVIPKVGKKIPSGDNETTVAFVDEYGQAYSAFAGRLYADDSYYMYYEVHAYFSSGDNVKINQKKTTLPDPDYSFNIPKTFGSSESTIKITFEDLLNLNILKREVLITVNQCVTTKAYDGTKALTSFSASASNITTDDAVMLELDYNAAYITAGAGINIPININYSLKKRAGYEGQDLEGAIGSYVINTVNFTNNSGVPDIKKGEITPLNLNIKFVDTIYTRKFNEPLYVVVRVAKSGTTNTAGTETLQEDLYYYYSGSVDMPYSGFNGYCTAVDLPTLGIFNYVIVEISGFKSGEGFMWDPTNTSLRSFMTNMSYSEPIDSVLDSSLLLSWYDSIKDVHINKTTDANATEQDNYRLEFSEGTDIAPNYIFISVAPLYAYLHIEKLTPEANVIIVEGESAENYLKYIGSSNLNTIFDTGKVKYTNHKEFEQITQLPSDLISVISFNFSCEDGEHDHSAYNINSPFVQNLTYSGVYLLRLSLPATNNYLPVSMDFEITIHTKEVSVYLTKAVRIYGEAEVVYDTAHPKLITDIDQYKYMIDSDGNIVPENGNVIYIYKEGEVIIEGNFVMYSGLVEGEYFGSDQSVDKVANVNVNPGSSNAGIYDNAITANGACKHNYTFNYFPTKLYVIRKELRIEADLVQEKPYTGDNIQPNYQIIGGPGNLVMYIIGNIVDGEEVWGEEGVETNTSVINVGVYILKAYAMPRVEDEGNYKVSDVRLTITLTVTQHRVVIINEINTANKTYDGQSFQLEKFNYYFAGESSPAMYSWGYVYIASATSKGQPVPQAKDGEGNLLYLLDDYGENVKDEFGNNVPLWDIRNSKTYILNVTAIITNSENIYFDDGESEKIDRYYFIITLEIEKSNELYFTAITSKGVITVTTSENYDETYNQVYKGSEVVFDYTLFASGRECSSGEIPVTLAVDNVLYSYNNNIYYSGAPIYNPTAASAIQGRIDGISYTGVASRNKMLNVGTYELKVYINYEGGDNYDSNYFTIEYIYEVIVIPAELKVYIEFDAGYGAYKVFGEDNATIEQHVKYKYSGWIGEEGTDTSILNQIAPPTIDWSNVGNDAVAGDDYSISSIGGVAPSNYVFNHSSSNLNFIVKKADSWIIVYGFYDEDTHLYSDYNSYSGLVQKPNVLRMAGTTPIDTNVETIGEAGIKITLEGAYIGNNKSKILPRDIDTSVKSCFDTGKYVFSISVIASTNYKAVEKAYYYYEVVKAELEMVFVVKEYDGENYTITEVRGYSSKIYDGDNTSYPSFVVQYKGFVGADDEINSYKNVLNVAHIGDLVYVIVGETMFQTFAKNFVSVVDGQGKYIKDSQGNYIMLNTSGNYIKDFNGNYISVTSIKGNYYMDGEDYKLVNGTYIKDSSNAYLQGSAIVGNYILDEDNEYVKVNEVVGKYATDGLGNYIKNTDTFMLTENNAYVNFTELVGVYYKDEFGEYKMPHLAVGNYFKNYNGEYINIGLAQGDYSLDENDEYVLVPMGEGDYIRNEDGDYELVIAVVCKYVKNFDGQYLAVAGLMGEYVKDKDGIAYKLSNLVICPFIANGTGGYARVNYVKDVDDNVMLFFKDSLGHFINCDEAIGTHIIDEFDNYIKVRTYLGNLVSFTQPYIKTMDGDFVSYNGLDANYVLDIDGNYHLLNEVVAEYIRNAVGDYLKVSTIIGETIIDENGITVVVNANSAVYFCDESGKFSTLDKVVAKYIKAYDNEFIRLVGDYVRLENFDYVNKDNVIYNYIKDINGNFIKIKEENGNIITGNMGNYVQDTSGLYTLVAVGTGTHILDENSNYVRVNGNYNITHDGIDELGLINPVYEIFNNSGAFLPTEVDTYKIRMVSSQSFGLAKNYDINVAYKEFEEEVAYPELEITKRPIDITNSQTMVTKTYDGYNRIPEQSITNKNYVFLKIQVEGEDVDSSGLVIGDTVNMRFDASMSCFMRKDVLDSNGEASQNYVKIYGFNIDNPNYILQVSESRKFVDDNGTYIRLLANITPASAIIRFIDENGKNITSKLEVVYDAERHPVNAIVQGVKLDDSTYETINFNISYDCAATNYHKEEAPKDAESYTVSLTINESNYVSESKFVSLIILKAEVKIVFGGDIIQTYGSVVSGLTAEARGVGGYSQTLQVMFYDFDGVYIDDITKANADTYKARAIHTESTNFKLSSLEEDFIINRRDMSLYYDLSSTYLYTGKAVAPKIYFMYEGVKFEPKLKFNYGITSGNQNEYLPFNYADAVNAIYPTSVGSYQVQAINDLQNFNITDSFWTDFSIVPVNITVAIADLTILTDKTITFNYLLDGAVNGETPSKVFTSMPQVRYYSADNVALSETPSKAGLYRVEPYGGASQNYNISYKYGMLSINNSKLLAGSNVDEKQQVIVEGSFAANITLNIREITNKNFTSYMTSFDAFKADNIDFYNYNIIKIYYLNLSDGSLNSSDNGEISIMLYVPELFNKAVVEANAASYSNIRKSEDGTYYVAHIDAQGNIAVIEAYREGDYLCFTSNSLGAYCVLTTDAVEDARSDDWVLYVSISLGIALVAIALIIVRKRA